MKKCLILIMPLLFCSVLARTQELRSSSQGFRPGDVLIKRQLTCPAITYEDTTRLWDFSHVKPVNEQYRITFGVSGDSLITANEHQTQYEYSMSGDTLYLRGYQTATTRMDYTTREVILPFPLREGDHYEGSFRGEGNYCGKLILRTAGNIRINARVTGTLILPEADTIRNVLRVESVKKLAEQTSPVNSADTLREQDAGDLLRQSLADSSGMRVRTVRWYAAGIRYPVFETVESTGWKEGEPYTHFRTAFMYHPENQYYDLPGDPENDRIRVSQEEHAVSPPPLSDTSRKGWEYRVGKESNLLTINLILERGLKIRLSVVDISGRVRLQKPEHQFEEGYNQETFNLSPLPDGEYLLVITAGNERVSEKFIK